MSRQRKTAAVRQLLRNEDLETVSRGLGVTAATLSSWRDAFLPADEASLTTRQKISLGSVYSPVAARSASVSCSRIAFAAVT
jgi:transposase-like protein